MVKSSCFKEVLYDGRYNSRLCKEQKEKEQYTVIDKVTVRLDEKEDKYISNCKLHHYGIVFDHNALSGA